MYRNLLKTKKMDFFEEKLRVKVGKPKELLKALKSLGLPFTITQVSQVSLRDKKKISIDQKVNNNSFKNFYASLALNLVYKLLPLVSKIVEKVIHNQTEIFLSKNKI